MVEYDELTDEQIEKRRELSHIVGKTIKTVILHYKHQENMLDGVGDCLMIKFTDGSEILLKTHDSEAFSSWLNIKYIENL